jgi:hypothetical protein
MTRNNAKKKTPQATERIPKNLLLRNIKAPTKEEQEKECER